MSVSDNYQRVCERMERACLRAGRHAGAVRLLAVTKTATAEQIREVVAAGVLDLGENRVQVLTAHIDATPGLEANWHMIGHLQRNKVKQVLQHVQSIQSVDSLRLAEEIDRVAGQMGRRVRVLMEVNAGEEPQKYGCAMEDAPGLARQMVGMANVELAGLMTMAPLTEDVTQITRAFARTRELLESLRPEMGEAFCELSMGMSHDFEIAIEQGATIVRVGSLLFG